MTGLIVASHQPDLFPHTGFWYKMAHADVFDLALHDQFQLEGYQRRVKMRGHWASVRLEKKRTYSMISDLELHPEAGDRLWNMIKGRYEGSKFWNSRKHVIRDLMEMAFIHDRLWMANTVLIEGLKEYFGFDTILRPAPRQQTLTGAARVAERVQMAGGTVYLSGQGARAYQDGREAEFWNRGIELRYSSHDPTTGDSILTAIFDDLDPVMTILKETQL